MKTGTGSLAFTGTNIYSGTTTINQGTLSVNGSIPNSTITVESGGILAGTGTVDNVIIADGQLTPGNSIGTLTGTTFDFQNGSTLGIEINPLGASDLVLGTGSVTIENGSTLNIIPLFQEASPIKMVSFTHLSKPHRLQGNSQLF